MTTRLASLAALLIVAACAATAPSAAPPRPAVQAFAPAMAVGEPCHIDSGAVTVTADRGIGGTGIGGAGGGGGTLADRGIGGTGIGGLNNLRGLPSGGVERGGGGTGIVGVITGFGSVCVNGFEVELDRPARLTVDGATEASETLRVGDVVVVETSGSKTGLHAVSIGVRHEVSGPITLVADDRRWFDVAGQRVVVGPGTRLRANVRVGAWVEVSGLRDQADAIRASRVDARAPGDVQVAGVAHNAGGRWRIGGLPLALPPKLAPGAGRVIVGGEYAGGVLHVRVLSDDALVGVAGGPRHIFVEGYPSVAGRQVVLATGLAANIGPAFGAAPPADRPVVLELVRAPGNALLAVGWHEARLAGGGHTRGPSKPATLPPGVAPAASPDSTSGNGSGSSGSAASEGEAAATTSATSTASSPSPSSPASNSGSEGEGAASAGSQASAQGVSASQGQAATPGAASPASAATGSDGAGHDAGGASSGSAGSGSAGSSGSAGGGSAGSGSGAGGDGGDGGSGGGDGGSGKTTATGKTGPSNGGSGHPTGSH